MRLFIFLVFISSFIHAQGIKRQVLSTHGNSTCSDGVLFRQTIGQSFNTETRLSDRLSYRPGFQQPVFKDAPEAQRFVFGVFPNPADEYFTIKSDRELSDAYLFVSDATGKQVYLEKFKNLTVVRLNCRSWAAGYYTVTLGNNREKGSHKLIINHQQ